MNTTDYQYLQAFIKRHASIVVPAGKEQLFAARLTPVAKEAGLGTIQELVSRLRSPGFTPLHQHTIDALTTNETLFFRDATVFSALRQRVLPELVRRRRSVRRLRIWSAAASTGQEAYSLAILLLEHFPHLSGWQVQILGTDLSRDAVHRAREGRYGPLEINRGLPAKYLAKYFTESGRSWRIRENVRALVKFEARNLAEPLVDLPPADLVLLRNVLIYFDRPTKQHILRQVAETMRPGSVLVLGTAESTLGLDCPLHAHATLRTTLYTREKDTAWNENSQPG